MHRRPSTIVQTTNVAATSQIILPPCPDSQIILLGRRFECVCYFVRLSRRDSLFLRGHHTSCNVLWDDYISLTWLQLWTNSRERDSCLPWKSHYELFRSEEMARFVHERSYRHARKPGKLFAGIERKVIYMLIAVSFNRTDHDGLQAAFRNSIANGDVFDESLRLAFREGKKKNARNHSFT